MSFYSSLLYYRPGPPPAITAQDLGKFLGDIQSTGLLTDGYENRLRVKFGAAVDADADPTSWAEPTGVPRISTLAEIEWDCIFESASLIELQAQLQTDKRTIYRASGDFGVLVDRAVGAIRRHPCDQNEVGFFPGNLSLEIGPIELWTLGMESPVHVGWIELGISGCGYLFPWTPQSLVERAEQSEPLNELASVCRSHWPVTTEMPNKKMIALREELEDAWPYGDLHKPLDWYWGVMETG